MSLSAGVSVEEPWLDALPDLDVNPRSQVPADAHKALRCHVENILTNCGSHGVTIPSEVCHNMLKQTSSIPPTRVGFYGESGVGKSTIVDRLLGINLLKSAAFGIGCKMVVEMLAHSDPDRQDFVFDFDFVSRDTVREWHDKARSDAQFWRDHPTEEAPSFLKWFLFNFTHEEIHYKPSTFAFEDAHVQDLPKYQAFLESYGTETHMQRVAPNLFQTVLEDIKRFSTFVQHVSIFGPFQLLRALHVSLIDIPSNPDGSWLYEERSTLAAKMCKDIYFVTDHRYLTPTNEKRLVHLAHCCDNLSLCRTHAASLLGKKPHLTSPEELGRKISSEIRSTENYAGYQSLQVVVQQIGERVYAIENCEGDEAEYDSRYDRLWTHFVESLKVSFAHRFDTDVWRRVNELNHLLALTRAPVNLEEDKQLREFSESLASPPLPEVSMSFSPKYADFNHRLPHNYKHLQCWLTHEEGYWSGEWRNSKMNDLFEAIVSCCYPYFVKSTIFDQQIRQLVDVYLRGVRKQINDYGWIKDNQDIVKFLLLRTQVRMNHMLLGSFRGFQAFFETKACVLLRERYGNMLQDNLRKSGVGCKEEMQRGLRNWFAMEASNMCENVLPKILQNVLTQFFAVMTERMRDDAIICRQQMSCRSIVRSRMSDELVHNTFNTVVFSNLTGGALKEMRTVDISALFAALRGTPALRSLVEGVNPVLQCPLKHGRDREGIHLSGVDFRGSLFGQKALHDVRVRCGRVEQVHDRGSNTFSSWTSKDAVLVESILHHCMRKTTLSRTLDYFHSSCDVIRSLTGKVVEYVESA